MKDTENNTDGLDFLSMEEAAKYLRVSSRTIWSKVKKGEIPAYRPTGIKRLLFRRDELERLVLSNPVK